MEDTVETRLEVRSGDALLVTVLLKRKRKDVSLTSTIEVDFDSKEVRFEKGEWENPFGIWFFDISEIRPGNQDGEPLTAICWYDNAEDEEMEDRAHSKNHLIVKPM